MDRFGQTVEELEAMRETNAWSDLDPSDLSDEATCDEYPFQYDCSERDNSSY